MKFFARQKLSWQAALILLLWACNNEKGQSLPTTTLKVAGQSIEAELALSPEQQVQGLMHRKAMPEMRGMLFSFPKDKILRFYMKNTHIPLSIAYLDKDGVVREIYDMQPLNESIVASRWPMRFALEMNQGWFRRHNVAIGMRVTLAKGAPLRHETLVELGSN